MDFKQEYQKEIQKITPSDEQCERIYSGVMQKLAGDLNNPDNFAKKKKPLYLKIAAVSGAAVCAAAVLVVVFTGLRSGAFLEINNTTAAGGNYVNNGHLSGGANAPNYADDGTGAMGGAAPGAAMEPSADGSFANSGTGEAEFSSSPSISEDPAQPSDKGTQSEGALYVPYLRFTVDRSICEVTVNGQNITYLKSKAVSGSTGSKEKAKPADSNLDMEILVYFDSNMMEIFSSDGTFVGAYSIK